MRTLAATTLALLLLLAGCGGDDDNDAGDSSADSDAVVTTTAEPGDDSPPGIPDGVGPNELLRQGTADEGVNFATSPGGVTVALNDLASPELEAQLQGSAVEVGCLFEDGTETLAGTGDWPADARNLTLRPEFDRFGETASESCSLNVGGDQVAVAQMEPVGP